MDSYRDLTENQMTPRFIHLFLIGLIVCLISASLIPGITGVGIGGVMWCIIMFMGIMVNRQHDVGLFEKRDPSVKNMTFKEFIKELFNKQNWKTHLKRNLESPSVWINLVFFVTFIITAIFMVQGLNNLSVFWGARDALVPTITLAAFENLVLPIMLIMVPITPLFIWWFIFINFKVFTNVSATNNAMILEARIRLLEKRLEEVSQAKAADPRPQ